MIRGREEDMEMDAGEDEADKNSLSSLKKILFLVVLLGASFPVLVGMIRAIHSGWDRLLFVLVATGVFLYTLRLIRSCIDCTRRHPVYTSLVLLGTGFVLLEFSYFAVYPAVKWFSNLYLTGKPPEGMEYASILGFIKSCGLTSIISVLLAPYFYVLWIWRHNNAEEQRRNAEEQRKYNQKILERNDALDAKTQEQEEKNREREGQAQFYRLIELFGSGEKAIQVAAAKGMRDFLANAERHHPKTKEFYQTAICILAHHTVGDHPNNQHYDETLFLELQALQDGYTKIDANSVGAEKTTLWYIMSGRHYLRLTNCSDGILGAIDFADCIVNSSFTVNHQYVDETLKSLDEIVSSGVKRFENCELRFPDSQEVRNATLPVIEGLKIVITDDKGTT